MVPPVVGEAPVIPPLFVPSVQLKVVLVTVDADNTTFVGRPLQIVATSGPLYNGIGLTCTVTGDADPAQDTELLAKVGVTLYTIEPTEELLGLNRV
jgi:hypothetical protein